LYEGSEGSVTLYASMAQTLKSSRSRNELVTYHSMSGKFEEY